MVTTPCIHACSITEVLSNIDMALQYGEDADVKVSLCCMHISPRSYGVYGLAGMHARAHVQTPYA